MKINMPPIYLLLILFSVACERKSETTHNNNETKGVLLQQLRTTYEKKEWFVPIKDALNGVTAEQAIWRDSSGNHSIGQLTHHLLFWNKRQLAKFNGLPQGDFSGNNDDTFDAFTKDTWTRTVTSLDSVMTALEKSIQNADETKLKEWYSTIANISVHNAYHTGQIVSVRKLQGSWDPEKGVK